MLLLLASAVASAPVHRETPRPVRSSFDLASAGAKPTPPENFREDVVSRAFVTPHNLDTRSNAVDMPEMQLSLATNGPVLLVGAMGGRSGSRYGGGIPKLAHVALGWNF